VPAPTISPVFNSTGNVLLTQAKDLMRAERYEEALNLIEQAQNSGYRTAELYRWQGDGFYNLLRLQNAIQSFEMSLSIENSYYALRGLGLSHLHRGHEIHRLQQRAESTGDRNGTLRYFVDAHKEYAMALDILRRCKSEKSTDTDAIYGLAMACEGASRMSYSMALSAIGKGLKIDAETKAADCFALIQEGLENSWIRYAQYGKDHKESGPLTLAGGMYLRKAMLENALGQRDSALNDIRLALQRHATILDDIDPNHANAKAKIRECQEQYQRIASAG
jgi:tetratricopeptide (TPR) repeat protein